MTGFSFRTAVLLTLLLWQAVALAQARFELIEGKEEFCGPSAEILNYSQGAPAGFQRLEETTLSPASLAPPLEGVQLVDFDFDNDGQLDQVFMDSREGTYISGTMFYVRHGPLPEATESRVLSIDELRIYPCQFDRRSTGSAHCPPYSQKGDELGVNVRIPGKKKGVFFRGRYTVITPFRYDGRTYLGLQSRSADTEDYGAVIEPRKGSAYRSVCLYRRGQ